MRLNQTQQETIFDYTTKCNLIYKLVGSGNLSLLNPQQFNLNSITSNSYYLVIIYKMT